MSASIAPPTPENIQRAADTLRAGGLVAIPTETVYGLAANASDPQAIARLFAAKGRPHFNPLISHVANIDSAAKQGTLTKGARELAARFWPGPLTFVVDTASTCEVCDLARAGLDSIALRIPAHPVAAALLQTFGGPIAAPSANPSGQISPTDAGHVAADMGNKVDLILDGGPSTEGLESTIIDCRTATPTLLRAGTISPEAIEKVWPNLKRGNEDPSAPRSPGQLLRHYAPRASLRLNARQAKAGEAMLGFGVIDGTLNLSPRGDLTEAATNLFAMLRSLDANYDRIAVAPIPHAGLGEAINDRLSRAANTVDVT